MCACVLGQPRMAAPPPLAASRDRFKGLTKISLSPRIAPAQGRAIVPMLELSTDGALGHPDYQFRLVPRTGLLVPLHHLPDVRDAA